MGGGLPPNQVVPMPEHQDSTHTHTVVGCVVVLINALCQQCVCVCVCEHVRSIFFSFRACVV